MQDKEYMDKFNSIISKLAFKSETLWFLDILYKLEVRFVDKEVPTAGVCMKNFKPLMMINKNFIKDLSDDKYTGLILHELLHLALFHNSRLHEDYNMQMWNAACDLEVNSIIDTYKISLPEGALLPNKFNFENRLSSEMYYKRLMQNQNGSGKNSKGKGKSSSSNGSGQSNNDGQNNDKYNTLDSHEGWAKNQAESEMQKQMTKEIIEQAVSNNSGNIDENLKDQIEKANKDCNGQSDGSQSGCIGHGNAKGNGVLNISADGNGKIKWNYILNRLIRRTLSKSFIPSFKRTSRRYGELVKGHIKNHEIDNIIIAVDTSGSIDEALHKRFMQEIKLIQRMFKIKIRYIQCDASIQSNFEFKRYTDIDKIPILGHGGTDFRPVFNLIDEKHYNPNAILYFTDGKGDYPKTSKYNTLWVLSDSTCLDYKETTPPFGNIISLENECID